MITKLFLRSTLDALSSHIAILDEHGIIIEVNAAWTRFAFENNFENKSCGVGDSYLDVCDAASGDSSEGAAQVASGIRTVIAGESVEFQIEYPCHSPNEKRWFLLRATRFAGEGPARVVVAHETITKRKKSELAFRKLSCAVEQSPVSIVITDLLGGIEYVNPKFCTLTGYSFEEVRGKNSRILKSGEMSAEAYRQMWATLTAGEQWRGEFHNRKKSGELFWVSASISPIRDDRGNITHFVAVKDDITGDKRADEVLREQLALSERLAKIAATAPGIIYSYRLRADGSACIPYASPRLEEFCGLRPEDLAERAGSFIKLVDPEDRVHIRQSIAVSARTLLPWRIEFRLRHPTKGLFWIESHATPERETDGSTLWHGFMSDITERKRTAETLRLKERLLSESQRLGHIGSWFDDMTGPFLWSEEMYRIFGVSPDKFIPTAQSQLGLVHPDDRSAMQAWLAGCAAGEKPSALEYRLTRPDGTIRFIQGNGEALYVDDKFVHMAGTAQDVTESKRAAQQLTEHKESEANSRRALENERELSLVKSRFVTLVSHEFRTPLGVINTAAHLLSRYSTRMSNEERSAQLEEIQRAVERMARMMEDLLVHGNFQNGKLTCKPVRVDVEAFCLRVISEVSNQSFAPRSIECTVALAAHEAHIDDHLIHHVLGNLLSNAVKYSPPGQPVMLVVERVSGNVFIDADTKLLVGDHLQFKVTDSGIGIPAAELPKLFQPFYRASNVGNLPGTGMGLAIVKQSVELHRGAIKVESEEGKGTTFWVWMPLALPQQDGASVLLSAENQPPASEGLYL